MAIAFDATCSLNFTASGTSLSTSFTVGAGANRLLVVEAMIGSASDILTGVTFNSIAMTRIGISAATTDNQRVALYYLVAPASGAHNIVISTSGATRIDCRALSYTGVDQTNTLNEFSSNTATGTITGVTVSVTPTYTNTWVVGGFRNNVQNTCALAPGGLRDNGDASDSTCMGDTNGTVTAGVATSMAYTFGSTATGAAGFVVAIRATDSVPASTMLVMF